MDKLIWDPYVAVCQLRDDPIFETIASLTLALDSCKEYIVEAITMPRCCSSWACWLVFKYVVIPCKDPFPHKFLELGKIPWVTKGERKLDLS